MSDPRAPIINIGAGRSGSTLLAAVLNQHPDISFFSETHFLAPTLWSRIFEDNNLILASLINLKNPEKLPYGQARRKEIARINEEIAEFVYRITKADPARPFWGYKEIWNGSKGFVTLKWSIYDVVFPRAQWVHLVRNPITYAPSSYAFVGKATITREEFEHQLRDWVRIHVYNSLRSAAGRYALVKYEDIMSDPKGTLSPLLEGLGMGWHDDCLKAFDKRYVPAKSEPMKDNDVLAAPFKIDGLRQLVEELGYEAEIAAMGVKIKDDGKNPYILFDF